MSARGQTATLLDGRGTAALALLPEAGICSRSDIYRDGPHPDIAHAVKVARNLKTGNCIIREIHAGGSSMRNLIRRLGKAPLSYCGLTLVR
jgi:hypothetical protein